MRRKSFSRATVGAFTPPVWKDAQDPRSVLNSSVKNNGTGVGVKVGAGVKVIVAVAGWGGVGDAVGGTDNSTCVGMCVDVLQAVRNKIPIRVLRNPCFLFMSEL
jgi:hypothetical protein